MWPRSLEPLAAHIAGGGGRRRRSWPPPRRSWAPAAEAPRRRESGRARAHRRSVPARSTRSSLQELTVIRRFLQGHPGAVLVVIVEDYVPPGAIAAAFADAALDPFVVTLHEGQRPPTLGELVRSNRRLLVFAEVKGGSPAWYMPAFTFIQDTPLGAVSPTQLSCRRYRGPANAPLA